MKVGQGKELSPRLELKLGENDDTSTQKSALQGNTLDMAYDEGAAAGSGRTITADAGAVNIDGPDGLTVNGKVGVGTTSPGALLDIEDFSSSDILFRLEGSTSAGPSAVRFAPQMTSSNANLRGFTLLPIIKTSGDFPAGININAQYEPSANLTLVFGTLNAARLQNSSFNVTNFRANQYKAWTESSYTGTLSNLYTLLLDTPNLNGSKPTNAYGILIKNQGISGTTNAYGLFVDTQSGAANNFCSDISGGKRWHRDG